MHRTRFLALALTLGLPLLVATPSPAPVDESEFITLHPPWQEPSDPKSELDVGNPSSLHEMPAKRRGSNTVGVGFFPKVRGEGDAAENFVQEVGRNIPGVNFLFTSRTVPQFWDQIIHVGKNKKRDIDLIVVAGHVRQGYRESMLKTPRLVGVVMAPDSKGENILGPLDVDLEHQVKLTEVRCKGINAQAKKESCEKLRKLYDVSKYTTRGAEVLVLSCHTGEGTQGTKFLTDLGTILVGRNGGTIVGPIPALETGRLGPRSPLPEDTIWNRMRNKLSWTAQIQENLKVRLLSTELMSVGDPFVNAGLWTRVHIPPQTFPQLPSCCLGPANYLEALRAAAQELGLQGTASQAAAGPGQVRYVFTPHAGPEAGGLSIIAFLDAEGIPGPDRKLAREMTLRVAQRPEGVTSVEAGGEDAVMMELTQGDGFTGKSTTVRVFSSARGVVAMAWTQAEKNTHAAQARTASVHRTAAILNQLPELEE